MVTMRKAWLAGAWAPVFVYAVHFVLDRGIDVYDLWPDIDTPIHFAGGLAIAVFVSGCVRALPQRMPRSSRTVVLELLLAFSLTATAAVFWEFMEFTEDWIYGTEVQVSLRNTMKDLAMGVSGAAVFVVVRARQLRASHRDLQAVAVEWVSGSAV